MMKKSIYFQTRIIISVLVVLLIALGSTSCKKKKLENDPRMKYVGEWNFKQTNFSYSGYYDYNVPPGQSPNWVSNTTNTVLYNDSTGRIELGQEDNELILFYGSSASPRILVLPESGNSSSTWTITESTFVDYVVPGPAGYTPSYSTVTVEGEKL